MNERHGSAHRRNEPAHDMKPGTPETLEALDAARVDGLGRMAWGQKPQVFQVDPNAPPTQHVAVRDAMWIGSELIPDRMATLSDILRGPTPDSAEWWTPAR